MVVLETGFGILGVVAAIVFLAPLVLKAWVKYTNAIAKW